MGSDSDQTKVMDHGKPLAEEMMELYDKAAKQGHAKAQFNLGVCYIDGIGVNKNRAKGVRLLRQAYKNGISDAAEVLKKLGVNP